MIHIANGWDSSSVNTFFSNIFIAGQLSTADVDIMGFSFYPFYGTSATLNNLKNSLTAINNKYAKVNLIIRS